MSRPTEVYVPLSLKINKNRKPNEPKTMKYPSKDPLLD